MAEDTEPQVTDVEESAPASEEEFIRLSKKDLWKELDRYVNEDPQFAHAVRTLGGRATKAQLVQVQAELEEARAKASQYEQERNRQQYTSLDPETLAERLQDPQFAAAYARAVGQQPYQPQVTRDQLEARAALEEIKDELRAAGAPEGWGPSIDAYVANGAFGQTVPTILRNVQRWADQQIAARSWAPKEEAKPKAETEEPEEEEPVTAPAAPPRENVRLADRTDTTPAARGGAGTGSRRGRASYKTKYEAAVAFQNGEISSAEMRRIDGSALPDY